MRLPWATAGLIAVMFAFGGASGPAEAQSNTMDCAHGPDSYRVRDVASWDSLNIRSGPGANYSVYGSIPADGTGVICVGPCEGRWCRINWRGVQGWANMRYLGE